MNLHRHCEPVIVHVSGKAFDETGYERCLMLIGKFGECTRRWCGSNPASGEVSG